MSLLNFEKNVFGIGMSIYICIAFVLNLEVITFLICLEILIHFSTMKKI